MFLENCVYVKFNYKYYICKDCYIKDNNFREILKIKLKLVESKYSFIFFNVESHKSINISQNIAAASNEKSFYNKASIKIIVKNNK